MVYGIQSDRMDQTKTTQKENLLMGPRNWPKTIRIFPKHPNFGFLRWYHVKWSFLISFFLNSKILMFDTYKINIIFLLRFSHFDICLTKRKITWLYFGFEKFGNFVIFDIFNEGQGWLEVTAKINFEHIKSPYRYNKKSRYIQTTTQGVLR